MPREIRLAARSIDLLVLASSWRGDSSEHLRSEINTLKLVANHANVIRLIHEQDGTGTSGSDSPVVDDGRHYMVMELMPAGDLMDLIQVWTKTVAHSSPTI